MIATMTAEARLAVLVAELRTLAGTTQQQLAEAAKVPWATVAAVESGRIPAADLGWEVMVRLAQSLRCPLDLLAEPWRE